MNFVVTRLDHGCAAVGINPFRRLTKTRTGKIVRLSATKAAARGPLCEPWSRLASELASLRDASGMKMTKRLN